MGTAYFTWEVKIYSFIYMSKGLVLMIGYEFRLSKMCLQSVTAVGIWKVLENQRFQLWPR